MREERRLAPRERLALREKMNCVVMITFHALIYIHMGHYCHFVDFQSVIFKNLVAKCKKKSTIGCSSHFPFTFINSLIVKVF